MRISFCLLLATVALASPAPVTHVDTNGSGVLDKRVVTITVDTPAGSIVGRQDMLTEDFNGIPFAEPPVGNLRLRPPVRLNSTLNNFDGTSYAPACPQFIAPTPSDQSPFLERIMGSLVDSPFVKRALKVSEDCLNLNVIRPRGVKAGDNLPVLFWMYGGGFSLGWNSMYDASGMVAEAAAVGKPNYRVGAWGWLAGKEMMEDGSTNLGHLDQRMGLEWVADNIAAFGGDPAKVTLWGESAGSISVFHHMAAYDGDNTYKGKPLFRAGIMNSGSMMPLEPVDSPRAQSIFDAVVSHAGCSGAEDKLECLRALSLEDFTLAANAQPGLLSYTAVAVSYMPRVDGKFLTRTPHEIVKAGTYAPVPFILGDQEDEGTLFSLFQSNISSTTEGIVGYLSDLYLPATPIEKVRELVEAYPQSISAGSPFNTGIFNEVYPGFKRLAALMGDFSFTITRRLFLEHCTANHPDVPAWSYLASYAYGTPVLGSFHASDLVQVFFGVLPNYASVNVRKYYANFVWNLDPNDASGGTGGNSQVNFQWPRWTNNSRVLVNFYRLFFRHIADDFRSNVFDVIKRNADYYMGG
ncbi:sterol esterase precursor [Trichosporon asahii var. asahii CBS 8904]|uniref:Carboxylic ester hydrolase n=1 Tax=Trichosporon asahii var. asahii (strain CBS 8904) TaxID=1220162 RepID=K1WCY6_TRIAC|nr:sterol esterase precursor [Trichosporon asahii var. asahii CBS 8904]